MAGIKNLGFIKLLFSDQTDTPAIDPKTGQAPVRVAAGGAASSLYVRHGYEDLYEHLKVSQDLITRYIDYENMDDSDPIIGSAYDIYADDATQMDYKLKKTMWVDSLDDTTRTYLNNFLDNTLKVEENIWEQARTIAKYGNDFEAILYDDKGVNGLDFISPAIARRYEVGGKTAFGVDYQGKFNYKDQEVIDAVAGNVRHQESSTFFDNWEMIHFRLRTKNRGSRYGFGLAENARWAWKRLQLLEDATILYKITRSPNRLVYYVNTGNKSPKESKAFMKELQREYRKKSYINPRTGKLEFSTNPLAQQEDIWVGVRDSKDPTRIENLPALDYQSLDELSYYRNKEFAGLKIPKRFLTYDETADSRTAGSNEDIRFARTVLRLQRELLVGYNKIIGVDYSIRGVDYRKLDYTLKMAVPSTAFEIANLEVENTKVALAAQLDPFVSKEWILTRILGMAEADAKVVLRQKTSEVSADLKAQNAALQAGAQTEESSYARGNMLREAMLVGRDDKLRNSREWAVREKNLDKRLNEIMDSNYVNGQKFKDMKKLMSQILEMQKGIRISGKRSSFGGGVEDDSEGRVDASKYFE
jgi:hypothetical protein